MTRDALSRLLLPRALRTVFQPIVDLGDSGRVEVHSYEGLSRGPAGTNFENPAVLFEYVRRKGAESLVDRICVVTALEAARGLPSGATVACNVHASSLGGDAGFARFLARTVEHGGFDPACLTVELVEHSRFWNRRTFLAQLEEMRRLGIAIALDDVGLGYANYRMILDARPDVLKADRYLVRGIDSDPRRRAVLRSLQELAEGLGARLVAEGVERSEEREALYELGVRLMQGFLFAPALSVAELDEWGAAALGPAWGERC